MNQNLLISFPIPIMTFLLCVAVALLIWRLDLGNPKARIFFSMMFALFALESLLVGLRFGYGIENFIALQRVMPLLVGPLMFLGFKALAARSAELRRSAYLHLGAAGVVMVGSTLVAGHLKNLDWIISASYLFYIIMLILLWRKGPDNLIHARLDLSGSLLKWMMSGIVLLVFILVLDTAIAISFAMQRDIHASTMITFGSFLLVIVQLVILFALPSHLTVPGNKAKTAPVADADGARLEAAARKLLVSRQLFLDPDLSVQRLAKRLHVPERSLSAAINQCQNMNVSQYVNGFRLEHAAGLLRSSSDSVSRVMSQSGFLTRSNFYREFARVYRQSPATYRRNKPPGKETR